MGDPTDYFVTPPASTPSVVLPAEIQAPRPADVETADSAAPVTAPVGRSQPFELVRTLQMLQDQMAQGSVQALAAQRTLRSEIDAVFAAAPANTWQDARNASAAVTYVLSGGPPQVLDRLAAMDPKPAVDDALLDGVRAYADGRPAEAAPLLANIDAMGLPPSMAAQVALAQSALSARSDPARTLRLLATARLLAPGTLLEEAAIRRQIFVADQLGDDEQVVSLAWQYFDRFRHSVYAGNFRARFASALSHMVSIDKEGSFQNLDDVMARVEPEARCELYLTVALASVINDRTTAAKLAAERASGLALADSVEEARARLYHAGALVAVPKLIDTAASDLAGVDRALLSQSDQALYDAVSATIAGVASGTDREAIEVAAAEPLNDEKIAVADIPALTRAQGALRTVDALLAESAP